MKKLRVTKANMASVVGEIEKIFKRVQSDGKYDSFDFSIGDYRRKNLKKPKRLVLTKQEDLGVDLYATLCLESKIPGVPEIPKNFFIDYQFEGNELTTSIDPGDYVLIDNMNIHIIAQCHGGRVAYSFVPVRNAS